MLNRAFSRPGKRRAAEAERLTEETKNLEQYRSEFFGRLRDVLGSQAGVRIEGDRFVFSSEVLFEPARADLSEEGQADVALKELERPIVVVDEDQALPEIFNTLIEKRAHIAVVVDGYGGTAGILTMEDVVETLLGLEIVDEFDRTADMQQLARKNWTQRARQLGLIEDDPPAEGETGA